MVKPPRVDSNGIKKGAWSEEEDDKLRSYVLRYGHWNWRLLPKFAGLARCGKSCRLRWVNYLKPGVKRGRFTKEEEDIVTELHSQLGNKWSIIAAKLPGRTDNEVKNFYHTRIAKKNKFSKHVSNSESSQDSIQDSVRVLERESSLESTQESTLTSSHLDTSDTSSYRQITRAGDDLWSELLQPLDACSNQMINDELPLWSLEEEFLYPDLCYTELSCSGSSYMSPLGWNADNDRRIEFDESRFFGGEFSPESNESTPMFDECIDFGMSLFS